MTRTFKHLPPIALVPHGVRNLFESSNVGAYDKGRQGILGSLVDTVLGADSMGGSEDILHDTLELVVDLLRRPLQTCRVLGHLETGNSNTTAVGSLARSVPNGVLTTASARLEYVDGFLRAAHVGTLSNEFDTCSDEGPGLLLGDLVLRSAWERNIGLGNESPGALVGMPLETLALDLAQDALLELEGANLEDILLSEASLVAGDQTALRVAHTEHASTEFDDLESGVLSDVAGTGDEDLSLGVGKGDTTRSVTWVQVWDHLLAVVDQAVSGGFGTSVGPSP